MSAAQKCPKCGAELTGAAFEGLCPACMVRVMRDLNAAPGDSPPPGSLRTPNSALRIPKVHYFGDYELLEEIARGGMGVVFRARQVSLNRIVALKMILAGKLASLALVQRFRTEAEAAANLKHPHIVAIHEVGEHEGQHYFSMDYIEGQSLAQMSAECEVRNAEWLRRAARCIKILAEAIHYAHQRGVLHRDLKPSNILLDADENPHITDFGLAKLVEQESSLTQSEAILGTPSYMSPEQAAGEAKQLTTAADIYSLGAIFYELLTGRPPFYASTALETMRRVMEEEPVPPWLVRRSRGKQGNPKSEGRNPKETRSPKSKSVAKAGSLRDSDFGLHSDFGFRPSDLDIICLKCLRKDPEARYTSAEALAEDLARWQNGEPIHARPVGPAEKLWRWCRRKPVVAGLIAALHVALAVGLAGILWQWKRAEKGELAARTSELATRQKAYASDMNLAQQALAQNNLGRAQFLLDRQRPQPGQRDLRGWEWRYLWQHCQSDALFALCQKSNAIFSLAVSPDGKSLVIGEEDDGLLSIWDLSKREEVMRFPSDAGPVFAVFAPRERLLAFSSGTAWPNYPHRVRLWDGNTEKIVAEIALENPCRGLAFSADGQTLATLRAGSLSTGREGEIALWKVPEGRSLARHTAGRVRWNQGRPFAIAPDLSMAAYAAWTESIRVVDLLTGQERWRTNLSDDLVTALAISPDGKTLAAAGGFAPAPLRLWNLASGEKIAESTSSESQRGYVCSLVFSPDGKTLVAGGSDQAIRLWDLERSQPNPGNGERDRPGRTGRRPADQPEAPNHSSSASPPRAPDAIGEAPMAATGTVALPSSTPVLRLRGRLLGHKSEVWSLAVLPDNQTLVSGGKDGSVLVWDMAVSPRARSHVTLPENLMTWSFDTNSQSVLTCNRQGRVSRWTGSDFTEERLFEIGTNFMQVAFLPHRSTVLARRTNEHIQIWDLQTRSFSRELLLTVGPPSKCFFMSHGNRLLIGSLDSQTLHEIDFATWKNVRTWPGPARLFTGSISPDAHWCITLGRGGESMINDLASGRARRGNIEIKGVGDATFSADGKLLAAASDRGFARIWDVATLQPVADLRGFLQGVYSVAFPPDGQRLVTGSDGKEAIKFWDVESHEELLTLEGQGSTFNLTAFSSDGAVLGSMNSSDGKRSILHLWRAPSWAEIQAKEKSRFSPTQ